MLRGGWGITPSSPCKVLSTSLVMSSTKFALFVSHCRPWVLLLQPQVSEAVCCQGPAGSISATRPQVQVWRPHFGPSIPWQGSCSFDCAPCLSRGHSLTDSVFAPACGCRFPHWLPWAEMRWCAANGSVCAETRPGQEGQSCLSEGPSG